MLWEAVFFDFDGVILDSVDVKTKAFADMFEKYGPEVQKKVIQHHLANCGVSRFDKFRYYYEKLLNTLINEKNILNLSEEFSKLVVNKVIESSFIDGAIDTLNELYKNRIPTYIVSGTPHNEINLIVKQKDLEKYFKEVHGSPREKQEIVQEILSRKRYNPKKCIFIGDAMSDYKAAKKNNMKFLGIVPKGQTSPFPANAETSSIVDLSRVSKRQL